MTVALDRTVRILKVVGFAERRGSAEAARALCEDVVSQLNRPAARAMPLPALREAGAGRPAKRDRRAIERFTGEDDV